MTPDIEELIKKVNTLTLDKTRLKQKLAQLGQGANKTTSNSPKEALQSLSISSQSSTLNSSDDSIIRTDSNNVAKCLTITANIASGNGNCSTGSNKTVSGDLTSNSLSSSSSSSVVGQHKSILSSPTGGSNVIAGIECSSSCEEDLLFINELFRKRLDEYSENWDYIQSKCSALLSELNALQKHYSLLKKEKLDLEEKLKCSCDENDKIKSELQTVVLNYEAQLSAMSEHLTMVASQVSMKDM